MTELLRQCPDIVLAGDVDTAPLIRAIFNDYGIRPKLFSTRRLLSPGVFTKYRFVCRSVADNEYFDIHTLIDIASPQPRTSILIPCSDEMSALAEKYSSTLETVYLIRRTEELIAFLPSYSLKRGLVI